jgi:high-affinity iron transporter
MIPTLVIGLREGLEASLIVGIVAAFLNRQGRKDALRQVWIGVSLAIAICVAVGVALAVTETQLPQAQQEGLETVVGLFAVAMVTYMILWMRKHSRNMKGELEGAAASALANGSARALVVVAFLAVLREGFETVVFLLAAFNASGNALASGMGALIGILISIGLGYGIYRGGVKINLSKFFRATGVVLAIIAAGLVMTAAHTATEAGWLTVGQQQAFDLSWLVQPGTLLSSIVTGVLGIQPYPVWIEVIVYFAYLIPMLVILLWPRRTVRQPRQDSVPVLVESADAGEHGHVASARPQRPASGERVGATIRTSAN